MIEFIKKLFAKKEPEPKDIFSADNPYYIRRELLWCWIKYLEGTYLNECKPMTYQEWCVSKTFSHEDR